MIVLISGAIASGKTTLAKTLAQLLGAAYFSSRAYLESVALSSDREKLIQIGSQLDVAGGTWLAKAMLSSGCDIPVVVDAVRTPDQVKAFRLMFPTIRVVHIHLEVDLPEKTRRLKARGDTSSGRFVSYHGEDLHTRANLSMDVSKDQPEDTVARCLRTLGLLHSDRRIVDCLVGGQYGSEGKGHVVAHIAPEYDVLVRVGGPNAGHTVVHPVTGQKVSFYHLPSGAIHNRKAKLILGPGAVICPHVLNKEAESLGGLSKLEGRLFIDPQAMVVRDGHKAEEAGIVAAIGSTGQGVGAATIDKIRRSDNVELARNCAELRPFISPSLPHYRGRILMEGTQGTGLSLHHGHYPHVTSRDTTVGGTMAEAGLPPHTLRKSIVVLRTFPIRVAGPSGPMGRETDWEEVSRVTHQKTPDELRESERTTTTKRLRRVAHFSHHDLIRAVNLNGPTDLALTFTDYLDHNQHARHFESLGFNTRRMIEDIEETSGLPVSLISTGTHEGSVIDRRSW